MILAGILLLATALRLWRLGAPGLWTDEAATWLLVRERLSDLLGYLEGDVHPPLYYLILWSWVRVAGASEWALRFVSAGAGVVSVAALYAAGRTLLADGRRAGLWAAFLLATSPYHVHYSQEAKSYAVLLLFCIAAFWMLARALREEGPSRAAWAAHVVLMTAALYVHVTAGFLVPGFALFALMAGARRRALLTLLPWLLFLPWLLVAGWSRSHLNVALSWADHWFEARFPWQPALSLIAFSPTAAPPQRNLMQFWSPAALASPAAEMVWLAPGVLLSLALVGLALWRGPRVRALRLALIPAIALAGLFAASLVRVVYLVGRTDAAALPFWLLLCAIGAASVTRSRRSCAAVGILWVLLVAPSLWMQYAHDFRSEDRALLEAALGRARDGDTLVVTGERLVTALYYVDGPGRREGAPECELEAFPAELWEHPAWETAAAYDSATLEKEARDLASALQGRRFLLLARGREAPEAALRRALGIAGRSPAGMLRPEGDEYPRWDVYEPETPQ